MTDRILWARRPNYANGEWIKLARNPSQQVRNERAAQGFLLTELPFGEHPQGSQDEEGDIRIYVACLAAYNSGILHGRWIDATLGEDHIRERIGAMLKASPVPGAEEYAIHDYEGFEGVAIEECQGVESVAVIAAFIEKHGAVGGRLVEHFGDIDEAREAIEERYFGEYRRVEDFVQESSENAYEIPEALQYYIDYEAMARDWAINDILVIETGFEEFHIFCRG